MEESLAPSQYKITSLSIDSRFADQNYGSPPDTSDFMIRLPETIKNVMRIRLSSTEIPAVEQFFTTEKGNTTFSVTHNGTTTSYSIAEGNYTETALAAAIQTALGSPYTVTVVQNRFVISHNSAFTLSVGSTDPKICSRKTHWGLGYYLGFRVPYINGRTIASTNNAIAYAPPLLQNNYYLMQLLCPDPLETFLHRIDGNSAIPAFAKIINQNTSGTNFDDNSNMIRKEHTFLAPTNISQLRIRILDPFGVPVRLNTADWSLTFEVTEIVNTKMYDKLNQTYKN
jgi:hypothetical protein